MNPLPRFLIDENLSIQLVRPARRRGYVAMHVRDLGLLGAPDWDLLKRVLAEDWTLVTNNVAEFRDRYRKSDELHAGVVFLAGPHGGIKGQIAAFDAALDDIDAQPELTNVELTVETNAADNLVVSRFSLV